MNDDLVVRVLHYSPHNENDGIAKYQEQYVAGMAGSPEVNNAFFEVSPIQFRGMSSGQQEEVFKKLRAGLRNYDILHIQHEFGLFTSDEFARLVATAKAAGKKVVVSVHLSPEYAIRPVRLKGLGPRSFVLYLKQTRHYMRLLRWHIEPFKKADLLLVHNDVTAQALEGFGIKKERIRKLPHPVYQFPKPPASKLLAEKLNKKPGDIIYCTVGMLHQYKGIFDTVRALKFLPDNYKLAIVGGLHPLSDQVKLYNKVCDLIDSIGVGDRVYITGFVEDDNQMNALIRECDVCVFPYDGIYYGNLSSGSINLAFANQMPVIAYPTSSFKELADEAGGAVVLCDTFAYYELARELKQINTAQQQKLSLAYAEKMAWPKMSTQLADVYTHLASGKK